MTAIQPILPTYPTNWQSREYRALEKIADRCVAKYSCTRLEALKMARRIKG